MGPQPTQAPDMQPSPLAHARPQLPQFLGSLLVFTQLPLHTVAPAGQLQLPPEQVVPPPQFLLQPPQLAGSVAVFTQA